MLKYRLINYHDVWGNQEDGWEVNNMCSEGELELSEDYTNNEIVLKLIDFGFFKPTVTLEDVRIWDDYHMIELYQSANNKPECRLELIENY